MFTIRAVLPFLTLSLIQLLPALVSCRPQVLHPSDYIYWNYVPTSKSIRPDYDDDWRNNEKIGGKVIWPVYRSIDTQLPGDPQDATNPSHLNSISLKPKLTRFNPMRGKRPGNPSLYSQEVIPRTDPKQTELRIQLRRFNAVRGKRFSTDVSVSGFYPDGFESVLNSGGYNLMRGRSLRDSAETSAFFPDASAIASEDRYSIMRGRRFSDEDAISADSSDEEGLSTRYNLMRGKRLPFQLEYSRLQPDLDENEITSNSYSLMRGKRLPIEVENSLIQPSLCEKLLASGGYNLIRGKRLPLTEENYRIEPSLCELLSASGGYNLIRGKRLPTGVPSSTILSDFSESELASRGYNPMRGKRLKNIYGKFKTFASAEDIDELTSDRYHLMRGEKK